MKVTTLQAALGSAALLLSAHPAGATHSHRLAHSQFAKKHGHTHQHQHADLIESPEELKKRGICSLPNDPDLVRVPGQMNNGFAMSPDQPCADGGYCPLACVPGKVMAQWDPNSSYTYPASMNGGIKCSGGDPVKPFPDKPYCVEGTNTIFAVNQCPGVVSFCQTVLPGNEAMLIPTNVPAGSTEVLAVPGPDYWAGTAAHYYVNPPGTDASQGCVWGDSSKPIGNWSPFVAGANTDANGLTFVKIAWNPVYLDCGLSGTTPSYGVSIECPSGGCNGLPCKIDPSKDGVNGVEGPDVSTGDGAKFCVVTVPKGQTANIVVFNTDGSKASASSSPSSKSSSAATSPPSSSKPAPPSTSSTAAPSSSAPPPSTSSSSSSSSSSYYSAPSSSSSSSHSSSPSSSSSTTYPTVLPGGIFHENSTYSTSVAGGSSSPATTAAKSSSTSPAVVPVPSTSKNEGAADQGGAAIAGLIVAIVAAAALY